eukprot:scaffold84766_cov63-Phaeocystis_antarctica.AAC.3
MPGGSSLLAVCTTEVVSGPWLDHPMSVAAMLCPLPSVESSTMLKASGVLDSAATTMQSPGTSGGSGGSFGGCGGAGGSGDGDGGGHGGGGSTVNE